MAEHRNSGVSGSMAHIDPAPASVPTDAGGPPNNTLVTQTRRLPSLTGRSPVAFGDGKPAYEFRHHSGEWLPAETATEDDMHQALPETMEDDTRHLLVHLDPARHHASGPRALRLNVQQGDAVGQWRHRK